MQLEAHQEVLAARLRQAQLKVTAPRIAVLGALESSGHRTVEAIFSAVAAELPKTSLQAVYGVLAALAGAGLARKIEPAGSPALYEARVGDNHHHRICLNCHALEDVDCVIDASPCLTPSNMDGFAVQAAEVTFWGLCTNCQPANAAAAIA